MATFEAQVEGLTSLSIDGSSAPTQTELTQFLTDGAAEVINAMPAPLKFLCATEDTFTSAAVGSEAETLESSSVLSVTRSDGTIDQPCREIPAVLRGKASDSDDMIAATATDPVYYIYNGKINALPASGSCKYLEVNNPTVAYSDSAISNFPDEYEYLVPLYASVKSLQNVLGSRSSNTDITTALTAINTELDETQAVCDLINTQVDAAVVQLGESATQVDASVDTALGAITTAAGRINTAVQLANAEFDQSDALLDLGEADSEGDVNTALTAINAEIDECLTIADDAHSEIALANAEVDASKAEVVLANAEVDKMAAEVDLANAEVDLANSEVDKMAAEIGLANGELDEAVTLVDTNIDTATAAINTAVDRVNTAVQLANTQFDSAVTSNTAEDIELASSHVNAGNGFISEANTAISEAQGFVAEVSARVNQVNAQVGVANGFIQTANAYANTASGFNSTAQGYLATANGYGNGNFCTLGCYDAWSNIYLDRAIDTLGVRITEPVKVNMENAWLVQPEYVYNRGDDTRSRYIYFLTNQ